jgi:hypothetical protein
MAITASKLSRHLPRSALAGAVALAALGAGSPAATAAPRRAPAATVLAVRIDASRPGAALRPGFVGLSFEAPTLSAPAITSGSSHLPNLLGSLGHGLLRFAGDSVDHTQWLAGAAPAAPWAAATLTRADLDHAAELGRLTGWRVLLGLNLGHPDTAAVADEARAATTTLGPSLAGLEIGNEPDLYGRPVPIPFRPVLGSHALRGGAWRFSSYAAQYATLRHAVANAAPTAPLFGPATAALTWLGPFVARRTPGLVAVSQHYYPLDRCRHGKVLAHGPSIASLLSARAVQRAQREIASAVATAHRGGLPLRLDEANSVACGGQPNTSDTFASALWALNFGLLSAHAGAVGVDFHGGLGSCRAMGSLSAPWYSPLCAQADGQLRPRPEYYGLLALSALEGAVFVPTTYRSASNVAVYALRAADGSLRAVIDDMDTSATAPGGVARPITLKLQAGGHFHHASAVRLSASGVGAKSAVTLGGASVATNGSFPGAAATPLAGSAGGFTVTVTPASAALVTLRP